MPMENQVEAAQAFCGLSGNFPDGNFLREPKRPKTAQLEKRPSIVLIHPRIIGNYLHLWAYIRLGRYVWRVALNAAALAIFPISCF